jgi:hypothetical protein
MINENVFKALKSSQMVMLYILLLAMTILMIIVPDYSWALMIGGSLFIVAILAVALASGYENKTEIIE